MEMAGAARGAVSSLLGSLSSVLVDEVKQLWGVRRALQSIKDEMESMISFLLDLEEVHGPSRQQKTWMKQVRDLAKSAERCIGLQQELILREGHRSKGFLRYLPPVRTLPARHKLAMEVRELNERIKGVNERRQRYGVQVPRESGDKLTTTTTLAPITGAAASSQAAGEGDEGIIPSDDMRALAIAVPRILEECTIDLVIWLRYTERRAMWLNEDRLPSIAIAAPDLEDGADVAHEALAHPSVATKFEHKLWITTYRWFWPAGPLDILGEILGGLLPESQEGEWAETEELDRKIEEIVKKTEEHLPAAGTERSPRVVPLEPLDILCDILQELLPEAREGKWAKTEELDRKNEVLMVKTKEQAAGTVPLEPLDILCSKPVQSVGKDQIEEKINETAVKIKEYLEELDTTRSWIGLYHSDYVGILRELLPQPKEDKPVKEATDKLGDDQIAKNIKEITNKIKVDILRELLPKPQEDKLVKQDLDRSGKDHIEEKIKETTEKIIVNMLREMLPKPKEDMDKLYEDQRIEDITKIKRILENIKEHLLVKEITKKIKELIEGKRTIIVLDGMDFVERWEVTKWALSKLGCAAGSAVIVITNDTKEAYQYCNPMRLPIEYSLVGFYHDKAISLTSPFVNEDYNNASILHAILKNCEPHELCMKLFVRALYANPKRRNEELDKLRDTVVFGGQLETNARNMIKFSYSDLPGDYKTCFLYLAIFPQGHKIKRSSLVGRWVAEGLVTEKDWPSSVHRPERCFDALIDLCLVYPCDIGAAGKVKSCIVHDIVHEFITKIARKEQFVETGHLSAHSYLPARSSEEMPKFLRNLRTSPQYPLVKVLDLEGCKYFKKNQNYLKNICDKMLLLKYLSLRNTDITKLPKEINNLHQLEVLDIQQTKVRAHATKDVLLLMLKRLLAGHIPISTDTGRVRAEESFSSVQIPGRIDKMTNMEVLSHVKASRDGHELKDIGKLWQLRKLGVVIKDKNDHLENLLRAISDLNECLQSLSIILPRSECTPSTVDLRREIRDRLRRPPKLLESLSISGITTSGQLLSLLANVCGKLTKLTLSCTRLNQDHLKDLGQLPKLQSFRLRHESYIDSNITFKKEEFQNLKYFLVEGSNMTEISFEVGAAPKLETIVLSSTNMNSINFEKGAAHELEKIVFSFTDIKYLRGVDRLPKLEVELNGNRLPLPLFDNANLIAKVTLRGILLKQGDLQILAKNPNMRCLMLLDKSCDESQLTFNKDDLPKLSLLVVECHGITNISFSDGAAPKLEKIVWSFTSMLESLSGIDNLPRLKELEFNGENVPDEVIEAIKAHPNSPVLKHNIPQNED